MEHGGKSTKFVQLKYLAAAAAATTPPRPPLGSAGPWLPLGTVAQPTGTKANGYSGHWNTLRLDSGRALIIGGQKGYWTKGCSGGHIAGKRLNGACTEGLYLPRSTSSFRPPYDEYPHNPVYSDPADPAGCECATAERCAHVGFMS